MGVLTKSKKNIQKYFYDYELRHKVKIYKYKSSNWVEKKVHNYYKKVDVFTTVLDFRDLKQAQSCLASVM